METKVSKAAISDLNIKCLLQNTQLIRRKPVESGHTQLLRRVGALMLEILKLDLFSL